MKKISEKWFVVGILILAFVLRLPLLNGSFWLDEAAQAIESARPFSQQLDIINDFQPPLLHYILHFTMFVSRSEWWLRLIGAVIPGLVTIWGTYVIGKKLHSQKVGFLAAFLLATSSFHIFYSQELRQYSLPALFAVLSWLVLTKEKVSYRWVWYALLSIGGLYSSYLYPFAFIAQFFYVAWRKRKEFLVYIGSAVATAVAFLPWLPTFLRQLQAGQQLRTTLPGWEKVVSYDQFKSLALTLGKFIYGVLDLDFNIWYVMSFAAVALTLGSCAVYYRKKHKGNFAKNQNLYAVLLCWLVLPILLAWVVSFVVPLLQPKRVLFSLPAFYILVSVLITEALSAAEKVKRMRTVGLVALALFVGINLFSTFSYYLLPKYQREDWRTAHQLITEKYGPARSVVVFAFPEAFAPWRWYDNGKFPVVVTGALSTNSLSEGQIVKKATEYQYVLVFDYLRDLTDHQNKIISELQRFGYTEVDQITPTTPLGIIHVFSRAEGILSTL